MQHYFLMLISFASLYLMLCCNFVTSRSIEVKSSIAEIESLSNVTAEEHHEHTKAVFKQITETNKRAHLLNDLFEGDIKLDVFRNAHGSKWPKSSNGLVTIPYTLSQDFYFLNRELIRSAMDEYKKHTCIRFVRRTSQTKYLSIEDGTGCWSYVGRSRDNKQTLSLSTTGCMHKDTILHELMHAIGFRHEQSRSDRDDYIRVIHENVNQSEVRNFQKHSTQNLVVYDYTSILHYAPDSFGKKSFLPTLKVHPRSHPSPDFGFRNELSAYDIEEIKYHYDCGSGTYTRCGRDFFHQDNGTFQNPGGKYYPSDVHCTWNITVRPSNYGNSYVKLRIEPMILETSKFCQYDSINVHDGINAGAPVLIKICGLSHVVEFTSTGNHMFVIFTTDSNLNYIGFQASFERVLINQPPSLTPYGTNLITEFQCPFYGDFCGMTHDQLADNKFAITSGSTPSSSTGPSADHTSGFGYYMYLEASNVKVGSNGIIRTPWFEEGYYCIEFYYHMYGTNVGGLRFYALENNLLTADKDATMLWERFKSQGNSWKLAKFNHQANQKVQYYWEGFIPHFSSDIAVDDIKIIRGSC